MFNLWEFVIPLGSRFQKAVSVVVLLPWPTMEGSSASTPHLNQGLVQ